MSLHLRYTAGLMLFCSGVAALIYQVVWVRLIGLTIGATAVGIAMVLAAFFGGMAAGSLVAQSRLRRGAKGLREFALAEGVTAVTALLLLPLLFHLDRLLVQLPATGSNSIQHFLLVLLLLLIPSAAIGSTFPFLAAWLSPLTPRQGESISTLYSLNTLGAMCGAVLAGFWLIPQHGLDGAIYIAAAINGSVALLAWWLMRSARMDEVAPRLATAPVPRSGGTHTYVALAATGFSAMAAEVVWSKYLSLYAGTTIYGFAAMTAVVLAGMAAGGWLIRIWLHSHRATMSNLLVMLFMLALALIVTRSGLAVLPLLAGDSLLLGEALHNPGYFIILTLVLLPSSLCFGATFPLALALQCPAPEAMRRSVGLALAVNTLAAIAGAVVAALWLIPYLGSDITLALLPLLPLLAAVWLMLRLPSLALRRSGFALALLLAIMPAMLPAIDYRNLLRSTHYRYGGMPSEPPIFHYLQEGRSGLIGLVTYDKETFFLQRNGLNEGMVNGLDAKKGMLAESLLGALPYLLQERPRDALVVGFGGGITARILAEAELDHVKVVELEPKVVEAMMQLGAHQWPFLSDGRVTLEYNDARASLRATQQRYSIIISQPSHPWLAGSANLYSREFFQLAHSRLRPGGVFAQWVNLFRMDSTTLRSILRTFYEVFPRGAVFAVMKSGDLLLMGGDEVMVLDYERSNAFYQRENVRTTLSYGGIKNIRELPDYLLLSREEALQLAANAPVASDANLLIEVRLAGLLESQLGDGSAYHLLRPHQRSGRRDDRAWAAR